ncbi:MAG: hypothetical protein IJY61_03515 [Candidatus Gastranaerophilales bacterium]|nr:hypothetical protein [Candidatus Gastranaerophilales bacterium]
MTIEGIITSPSFIKVKTVGEKERFLNSNFILSVEPNEQDEKMSDIVMLNGKTYTIKETSTQLMENRYRRDVRNGASIINFLG